MSITMSGAVHNVDGSTMADFLSSFQTVIRDMALQLEDAGFFQNHSELASNLQEFLKDLIRGRLPDHQWPTALSKLTNVLNLLHMRPVIVLINKYNSPMSYAVQTFIFY